MWPHSFAGVLQAKIGDAQVRRKIALEGHRFSPKEALDAGILDHIVSGNTAAVLAKAEDLGLVVGVKAQSTCCLQAIVLLENNPFRSRRLGINQGIVLRLIKPIVFKFKRVFLERFILGCVAGDKERSANDQLVG